MARFVTREVSFRPTPLRRAQRFRLEDGRLAQLSGDEVAWALDLAAVDRAVFVDFGSSKAPIRRFDIFAGGVKRRVAVNASGGMGTMHQDMDHFLSLVAAICHELAAARPALEIELGEYGATRWALFGLAGLMILGGAGLFATALASGVAANRLAEMAVPMGLLVVVGGFIGWANRPGAPRASLPPAALAIVIEKLSERRA